MKILLAPDSFKGTFTSMEVIHHLEEAAKRHFPDVETVKVPIADGGEGTVEALVTAASGQYREVYVTGPMGGKVKAKFGAINGDTAVIEVAQASGITLVSNDERNPLRATTFGTGELIKAALDDGFRNFIVGIGGSATNDGGIGAAQALGIKFLDKDGLEIGCGGGELHKIDRIDAGAIDSRIKESSITIICDVSNPMTGPEGATMVYGPQKGADEAALRILEEGMKNYAGVIRKTAGVDVEPMPGLGAAGGFSAPFVAFFNAQMKPGIETILDVVHFDRLLEGVDLVITGEGKIDGQSVYGKVPVGIAKRCKAKGIGVVAVVGGMGSGAQAVYEHGIDSIIPTVNKDMSLDEALSRSEELMRDAADRLFRLIKVGMNIRK